MSADHVLLEQAERFARDVAPRAAEIEAARSIPPDLSARMGAAGFYRMFIVERLGGLEVAPGVAARVYEEIARGDAACAWVAFIGATTGLALSRMPDEAVAEMLASRDNLITGVFAPSSVATAVAGGFRVNGRWQWGSGAPNAHWIGGGCTLVEHGKPLTNAAGVVRNHMLFFPAAEVRLLDTWHVSGLCGTGSTAFEVRDCFVPERRASGYLLRRPPDRPLFRFPPFAPLAHGVASVALGIARASIDELVRVANQKQRGATTLANWSHLQIELARAEARLRSARAFFYETIEATWQAAQSDAPVAASLSRDLRLSTTHAAQEAAAVVDTMYSLAGGTAIYDSSPLQRHFRDVHVATQHMLVSTGTLESIGRLLLGLEADALGF
jgi:alkylation response protein AidB-like acyl-CoA dehydrogenase